MNFQYTSLPSVIGINKCYKGYLSVMEYKLLPALWSYDYYPFELKREFINNSEAEWWYNGELCYDTVEIKYKYFYDAMNLFSERSRRTSRPFFAYCMCCEHKQISAKNGSVDRYHPAPTLGMLKMEAFTALAMGAQGIVYWRFGEGHSDSGLRFRYSPIQKDLTTSQIYKDSTTLNEQILKFNDVFLGCQVKEYFLIGDLFLDCLNIIAVKENMTSFECFGYIDINIIKIADQKIEYERLKKINKNKADGIENTDKEPVKLYNRGALISSITNNSKNYIVIVNQNPFEELRITAVIKDNCRFKIITNNINRASNQEQNILQSTMITGNLKPGDCAIIEWS